MVTGVSKSLSDLGVSYPDYLDWRTEQRVFVDLSARFPAGGIIAGIGEPERVFGRYVTASFFSTLQIQPQIGRFFGEDEDKAGAAHVLVIERRIMEAMFQWRSGGDWPRDQFQWRELDCHRRPSGQLRFLRSDQWQQ